MVSPRRAVLWILAALLSLPVLPLARVSAQIDTSQPYFLVATRDLGDPNFAHSVVLILPSRTLPIVLGVIINRPTTMQVQQLFEHAPVFKKPANTAFFGGPVDVEQPSLIRHVKTPEPSAIPISGDLYLSIDPRSVPNVLQSAAPDTQIRLYLGRAQWSPLQLRREVAEGSWFVEPADTRLIFSTDPARVWTTLVNRGFLTDNADPHKLMLALER